MWCHILNNINQGAPYRLYHSHIMNVPIDYDDKVDHKATRPALLYTKQDNKTEVLPNNWNIPKAYPTLLHRSVLGDGLKKVRFDLEQFPLQNEYWGTAQENISDKIYS